MAGSHGTKAIIAAFFANLGLAIAKFVAYVFTGSATMLAESIHSLADTSNQALLFWGGRRAVRAPDERFQFGYARERYFWAFVVALVLFSLGGLFSIFEGYEKIRHPEPIESAGWAFAVLTIGIALEGWSFRTAVHESRPFKGDRTWWGFIRTARTPELPVVLLEDFGALVGLILALIAISLSIIFDAPLWDAIGTITIGILLVAIAVTLAIEMKGLLIGESARPDEDAKIRAAIAASPHVERIIHMRTQHLGPEELLVGAKVEFHDTLTADQLADAINEVEVAVRAAVPHARPMYIEPDFVRTTGAGSGPPDEPTGDAAH